MKFKAIMRNKHTDKEWKWLLKGKNKEQIQRKLFDAGIFVHNDVLEIKGR